MSGISVGGHITMRTDSGSAMNHDAQPITIQADQPEAAQPHATCSFEHRVAEHIGWVYSIARRQLADADLAQDATQAVFLILWRKRQHILNKNQHVGSWLVRTTYYACSEIRKSEHRRKIRERKAAAMRSEETRPFDEAAESKAEQLLALDAAMQKLSTAERDILVARFFQSHTAREVSQRWQISEAAAEKRTSRAVEKLRQIMERKKFTMDSMAIASLLTGSAGTAPSGLLGTVLQSITGNAPISLTTAHAARSIAFHTAHIPAIATAAVVTVAMATVIVPVVLKSGQTPTKAVHAIPKSPLPIDYATTRLTGPLNKDGGVDYVAAFNQRFGKGVTPQNNAAVPLLILGRPQTFLGYHFSFKHLGSAFVYPDKNWGRAYRRALGISRSDLVGLKYVGFWIFCHKADKTAIPHIRTPDGSLAKPPPMLPSVLGSAPWSARANPWVAAWLAVNGGVWDVAAATTRRPRLFIPLCPRPGANRSMLYTESGTLTMSNSLGAPLRGLMLRAMLELHHGHIHRCESDLLAAHRIIALLPQEGMSRFSFFDGFSPKMLCGAELSLAKYGNLSASQLHSYFAKILRFHETHSLAVDWDTTNRWRILSMFQIAAETGGSARLARMGVPIWPPGNKWTPDQCAKAARLFNHLQDQVVAALRLKHLLASATAISSLESAWRRKYRGTHIPWSVAKYFTTMQALITTPHARSIVRWRMVRLGFALAGYRKTAGRFPARLAELAPKFIALIPHDPFTDKPFKYTTGPTGCTISSPGEFPPAINPGEAAFRWKPITIHFSQTAPARKEKRK